ncbi:MAG: methyltransferase domain-containing protein, partial [Chakrabartia sp.]
MTQTTEQPFNLTTQDRFNQLPETREQWQRKNRYYYDDQRLYMKFLVPEGLRVLEIGCGLGDLLASLKPSRGLGIDLNDAMVKEAARRHPSLEFVVADAGTLDLDETFDVIILVDVVGSLLDVETALRRLRRCCAPHTRLIISYYNFLWEPILKLAERLGLKMPQQQQNWLTSDDLANLLHLANYQVVKTERRLLLPKWIPLISAIANRLLAFLPGFRSACLCHYVVARPPAAEIGHERSVTVVIPCRNEQGNIEAAIRRLPAFGSSLEVLFVEGNSTDGTREEIERVIRAYPG